MPLLIISVPIIVAIIFFNIGKHVGIKQTLAKQAKQQETPANKNTADKEIEIPTPKGDVGQDRDSPYKIECDPMVMMYAHQNKKATQQEEKQKMQEAIRMQIQMQQEAEEARKRQQLQKIPWGLVGALGPDVVRKFMGESEKKLLDEELRKRNGR